MVAIGQLEQIAAAYKAPTTVVAAIRHAAERTGVDFGFLLDKAKTESSLNPAARAKTSSATGLFQFIERTWLQMVRDHGAAYGLEKYACAIDGQCRVTDPKLKQEILALRKDPTIAAYMAAEFTKGNEAELKDVVKGEVGRTELYLAHFLGAGGAKTFLRAHGQDPAAAAAHVLPEAAAANPQVFYKQGRPLSLGEVYHRFAAKFDETSKVFDTAPTQPLPQSPAQLPAMAALTSTTPIHASAWVPEMQGMDVAPPAQALRQQVIQQQLAYLTQVALETLQQGPSSAALLSEPQRQSSLFH